LAKVAVRGVDLEPIDRLEEKVKLLVGMIDRLRADQARAADEHTRLTRELDGLKARLNDAECVSGELAALRDERNLIRSRVGEMLTQIESLNL
jgi:hypothetical protein